MTTDPDSLASPVCWLPQADDVYAGYASAGEVEAQLQQWISRAPTTAVAAELTRLLMIHKSVERSAATLTNRELRDQIHRFLPKIRDDTKHQALADIAKIL